MYKMKDTSVLQECCEIKDGCDLNIIYIKYLALSLVNVNSSNKVHKSGKYLFKHWDILLNDQTFEYTVWSSEAKWLSLDI